MVLVQVATMMATQLTCKYNNITSLSFVIMKSKYVILSIAGIIIMGFWLAGGSLLNTGLHPIGIIAVPLFIINSFSDQEKGGVCSGEDCGPCWQFSTDHLVIDGQCKIPKSLEECKMGHGGKEVRFVNNKCELRDAIVILD